MLHIVFFAKQNMPYKINNRLIYLLILLVTLMLYGNSISNEYSLDDHLVNAKNELTQHGIKGIKEIFTHYSFTEKNLVYTYRPVLLTSFTIEYTLFGVNPHISHAINILLYALFVMLLFYFLQVLFSNISVWVRLLGVLLFLVHPLHTELVDNIKSRDELLVAVFGLSMLIQFVKYVSDKKLYRMLLIVLFAFLGLLSKQSMWLFMATLPVLYFISIGQTKKRNRLGAVLTVMILLISLAGMRYLKHHLLAEQHQGRPYHFYENPLVLNHIAERIPAGFAASLYYLKMLIYPFNLSYYYGYNQIPLGGWNNVLPYVAVLFYVLLMYLVIRFYKKNTYVAFALGIYLINIAATANVFKLMPGIIADRFIFWGSVGYCMLLAYGLVKLFEKIKWFSHTAKAINNSNAFVAVAFIILAYGAKVYSRNKVWKNEFSLISADVENVPQSAKAHDMYAFQLLGKIKTEKDYNKRTTYTNEAIKQCEQCLAIYPRYTTCLNNLGTLYFSVQNYNRAEVCFKQVVEIDSADANPLFNLANIYRQKKETDLANQYYKKALTANPDIPDLIPVYKQFVVQNNLSKEALLFLEDLLKRYPAEYTINLLLVDLYQVNNDPQNMLVHLKDAYKIKPDEKLLAYIKNITNFVNK